MQWIFQDQMSRSNRPPGGPGSCTVQLFRIRLLYIDRHAENFSLSKAGLWWFLSAVRSFMMERVRLLTYTTFERSRKFESDFGKRRILGNVGVLCVD